MKEKYLFKEGILKLFQLYPFKEDGSTITTTNTFPTREKTLQWVKSKSLLWFIFFLFLLCFYFDLFHAINFLLGNLEQSLLVSLSFIYHLLHFSPFLKKKLLKTKTNIVKYNKKLPMNYSHLSRQFYQTEPRKQQKLVQGRIKERHQYLYNLHFITDLLECDCMWQSSMQAQRSPWKLAINIIRSSSLIYMIIICLIQLRQLKLL